LGNTSNANHDHTTRQVAPLLWKSNSVHNLSSTNLAQQMN